MSVENAVRQSADAVYTSLGPGFRENVYHKAMVYECSDRGIPVVEESTIPVTYKDAPVARLHPDMVVGLDDSYIVELKTHEGGLDQLKRYLRMATKNGMGFDGGVLIVFGESLSVDLIE